MRPRARNGAVVKNGKRNGASPRNDASNEAAKQEAPPPLEASSNLAEAGAPEPTEALTPPRRGPGQPTKWTPERERVFLESIRLGLTTRLACDRTEISHVALYQRSQRAEAAIERGEENGDTRFLTAWKKARGDRAAFWLGKIHSREPHWQRFAWLLERIETEDFALRSKVEVTGEGGAPIGIRLYLPKREDGT